MTTILAALIAAMGSVLGPILVIKLNRIHTLVNSNLTAVKRDVSTLKEEVGRFGVSLSQKADL